MTVLEQRFMDAAIAYFTRNRKEKKFIEVTTRTARGEDSKKVIKKDLVRDVETFVTFDTTSRLTMIDGTSYLLVESYDEIKSMLYE